MRKKLARINRGQLIYGKKGFGISEDETKADYAIGFGQMSFFLLGICGDGTNPREVRLKDLGFCLTPDTDKYYLCLEDSEIVIAEASAVIDEANRLLIEHPEKDKRECVLIACPYRSSIDLDRISIAINREYYYSHLTKYVTKRKIALTIEESKAFIENEKRSNHLL